MNQRTAIELGRGWRRTTPRVSLAEVHRSVVVPVTASFWRKLLAFSGPGFLVAVGYMGPGDLANDPAGGARVGYSLLAVRSGEHTSELPSLAYLLFPLLL